jgi:hypothetical protein
MRGPDRPASVHVALGIADLNTEILSVAMAHTPQRRIRLLSATTSHGANPSDAADAGHRRGAAAVRRASWSLVVATVALGVFAGECAAGLPRIAIVGDSVQTGTNLHDVRDQAAMRLARRGNVIVHLMATPGVAMADSGYIAGMTNLRTSLLSGPYALRGIVVHLGVTDWGADVTLDAFAAAYGSFLDGVPARVPVACMTPTWTAREGERNGNGDTVADFRAAVRAVCIAHGATVLDGLDAVPATPSYFDDPLHPNAHGHRAMAAFLLRAIRGLGWIPSRPCRRACCASARRSTGSEGCVQARGASRAPGG